MSDAKSRAQKSAKARANTAKKTAKTAAKIRKHGPQAKTSFSNNVLPVLAGISMMFIVLAALNGQWIEAQYKYRFSKPAVATVVTDTSSAPTTNTKSPHPELGPQLIIPSINVQAPVKLDQGTAEWQIQIGLRSGVVHYDNSANPGDPGNVAIFGHSSGQLWAPGDYKFIFTLLNKVAVDDAIYIDYHGARYTYKVVGSEVVAPTDTNVLQQGNGHDLTLITCTPVGTSKNRLVVHAQQVSPAPTKATTTNKTNPGKLTELPGSAH